MLLRKQFPHYSRQQKTMTVHDCTLEYSEVTIIMLKEFGLSPRSHRTPSKCSNVTLQLKSENQALKARLADEERECHSSTGNSYRIVSDSAKYCNEHMDFGSDFAPF
ncbi:hypothetical protein NC653_030492 [Populus alba x Populus x berolinensis]|uniref:Uncharacterized protein n=1 Tax=Populus alba x Populus x berolinensis TaxID=444605 RepID=A0AAD6LW67_9ROSI|nr:hypothetical protein NC653_030492 [Populus alba x Populus x berolinensis]